MQLLSQLQQKDVINICTGSKLGVISDLLIDDCKGKIIKIIVCDKHGLWSMFTEESVYEIPWECIKRIGSDAILVDVDIDAVER